MVSTHIPPSLLTQALLSLLLFSSLLTPTLATNDILMIVDDPENCLTNQYYDCNLCPCNLTKSSVIMTLVLSLISLMCSFLLIVGHYHSKEIRERPGDIIFAIAICNVVFSLTLMIDCSIITRLPESLTPDSDDCTGLSYVNTLSSLLIVFYHISFCAYYLISLNSSLKLRSMPHAVHHIFPLVSSGIFLAIVASLGGVGRDIYGYCELKTVDDIAIPMIIYATLTITLSILSYLTFRIIPQDECICDLRNNFLRFYSRAVIGLIVCYLLTGVVETITVHMTHEFLKNQADTDLISALNVNKVFKSLFMVATPLVLIIARFTDRALREQWKGLVLTCLTKYKMITRTSAPPDDRKVSIDLVTLKKTLARQPYVYQFQHSFRVEVVYSLLSAIHYFWHMKQEKKLIENSVNSEGYSKESALSEHFPIDMNLMNTSLPDLFSEIKGKQYNFANGTFTAYASGIFEELIELDDVGRGIRKSLDLKENFNRILKSGINGGGKSGEFFFFSNDNKLIIKSISNAELRTLLKILPAYLDHFKTHKDSLIAKIYGVFTLTVKKTNEKYNLILMRNINGLPTMFVKRKYDIKGSTVGRRALLDQTVPFRDLYLYGNLKDLDFERYEGRLHIRPSLGTSLLESLKADAAFLASQNLVDYSMAVYIVDKEKYIKRIETLTRNFSLETSMNPDSSIDLDESTIEEDERVKEVVAQCTKHLNDKHISIKSTREDLYYHIGIIDYLVPFNLRKRLELFFKTFGVSEEKKDISIQKPDYYASRFAEYAEKIMN